MKAVEENNFMTYVDTCFGFVGIQFETMGWTVLGVAGTWLEWYGERYETREDYQRLIYMVESNRIREMLGRMEG